jgi:ribokinase
MSPPNFDVLVCGSLHLDIMVDAPHIPRLDETVAGKSWKKVFGGKGGNQAVHASRLGAKTSMIGRIGSDDFGAHLAAFLDDAGVDRTGVEINSSLGSGMSVAIIDADGNYGAVIVSGANLALDPSSIAPAWKRLGGARVLVLQNEVPEAVNIAAATVAREAGAIVIFNAAPARKSDSCLLDLIDILVVNRVEAEMFSGATITSRRDAIITLPTLARGRRDIIITLGGEGLVAVSADGNVEEIEPLDVTVVSTHGAGDCFVGALACRLANGDVLHEACRFANQIAGRFVADELH